MMLSLVAALPLVEKDETFVLQIGQPSCQHLPEA